MKSVLTWFMIALLALPMIASAEEYGWMDDSYILEDIGVTLTIPEGLLPQKKEHDEDIVYAATPTIDSDGYATLRLNQSVGTDIENWIEDYLEEGTESFRKQLGRSAVVQGALRRGFSKTGFQIHTALSNRTPLAYFFNSTVTVDDREIPYVAYIVYLGNMSDADAFLLDIQYYLAGDTNTYSILYSESISADAVDAFYDGMLDESTNGTGFCHDQVVQAAERIIHINSK